jgi:hypothetical protein
MPEKNPVCPKKSLTPPQFALNSPLIQPDFRWQKKPHTSLNSFPNFAILMPSNPNFCPNFAPQTPPIGRVFFTRGISLGQKW